MPFRIAFRPCWYRRHFHRPASRESESMPKIMGGEKRGTRKCPKRRPRAGARLRRKPATENAQKVPWVGEDIARRMDERAGPPEPPEDE